MEPGSRPIEAWNDVSYDAVRVRAYKRHWSSLGAKKNSKSATCGTTVDAEDRIILRFAVADEIFCRREILRSKEEQEKMSTHLNV
ncbi:hypothetical protein CEXT_750361 [Caerostris extrusa]|uniref:Uncharacterized protein n=1 Tax=Caerostris extrusa TaxID=172846 RepID=A0AAV4UKC6_CAEEX|nr:hypothetical protein CEXT_750361 [Caerostris extrusa]